jgi:hypothetical protein
VKRQSSANNGQQQSRLLDRKALGERHPALQNRWRADWLIRKRGIPMVRVGRLIFFDEVEIEEWIANHKIQSCEEDE